MHPARKARIGAILNPNRPARRVGQFIPPRSVGFHPPSAFHPPTHPDDTAALTKQRQTAQEVVYRLFQDRQAKQLGIYG